MSIPWRTRPDLQITPPQSGGRRVWGVKDPVTLSYYEQREEEYFVMRQMERACSFDEICAEFGTRFRPQTLAVPDLNQFLVQLIQQGLLVSQQPGYGHALKARADVLQQRRQWAGITNLLAIRFRGFDPDRMLSALATRCGWLFSPWVLATSSLLIVSALLLVVIQFDELVSRLPEVRAWLTSQNVLVMACVLACVKVLHELGHGLACKRFGGECHEMGFMLLVFTPCLYCNVSDAWMLRNKWERIAVSAAGIWVEATIAAGCTFLWWFSEPGLFHSICLNLMFVCGVSTLLFNGNPLLRYDGYFILSDWLEIPNLQQKGVQAVRRRLADWYFGVGNQAIRPDEIRQEMALFAYGVVSAVYRLVLTISIIWFLFHWLEPHGLGPFVQLFAATTIAMMVVTPLVHIYRWTRSAAQQGSIRWSRFRFRSGLTLLALSAIAFTPLPTRVWTVALLEFDDAARVYVTAEGTLIDSVKSGSTVTEGQMLARLVEPRLERDLARLEGEVHEHRTRLDQLERRRVHEPGVALLIPSTREALNDAEQQFQRRKKDADRLELRAPRSGIVIPPPPLNRSQPGSLPGWSSTPLDERNRGCFLKAGTTVCLVGDRSRLVAMLLINQDQLPLVRAGQTVRMQWAESPGQIYEGEIIEVAALDIEHLSADVVRRTNLPTRITTSGQIRPVGTWYNALVRLPPMENELLPGAVGEAKIVVNSQSLWTQFRRWLGRTFAFQLRP